MTGLPCQIIYKNAPRNASLRFIKAELTKAMLHPNIPYNHHIRQDVQQLENLQYIHESKYMQILWALIFMTLVW